MKCLIVGGGGFLGTNLLEALATGAHVVRVLDRHAAAPGSRYAEWLLGDFGQAGDADEATRGCELVFHLGGTTLPRSSNDDPAFDVHSNVEGTLTLLDAARRNGVRKVVFISSGGTVYGVPGRVPIPEDHPTDPISSYGITKLAIEKYLELYRVLHGLEVCVLRVANPYGEHQRLDRAQGAVAVFLDRVLRGQPIEIWGDGSVVRDFVYVGDVAAAMSAAAFSTTSSRLFNIGSGRGTSLLELVAEIEAVTGLRAKIQLKPGRAFDVPSNVLDISRARAELGWSPVVSMQEGLRRTVAWLSAR